jgi:non-heme chloroperoxidase
VKDHLVVYLVVALASRSAVAQTPTPFRDPSPHRTQFVAVEEGVQLEVLDWGGTGRPLVFLAGYRRPTRTMSWRQS